MRIVTGSARGINLITLEGETTRPTPAVVKEAIFSSIQFDIEGRTMLDIFAGSGQMGLEALSRGAEKVTFVDSNRDAVNIITENAKKTKLYQKTNVLCMDWKQYIKSAAGRNAFDIVFVDPPYAAELVTEVACALYDADMIKENGMLICESGHELDTDDVMISERFDVKKKTHYGRVYVTYLTPKTENENE
ncbi:MAG: 16S rRNA (guanine(966)-N(2))-methyltransferase RsmD [Eubacteriales bacterium]